MASLWRGVRLNWKKFFISFVIIYSIFYVITLPSWIGPVFQKRNAIESLFDSNNPRFLFKNKIEEKSAILDAGFGKKHPILDTEPDENNTFSIVYKGQKIYIKEILTAPGMPTLKERLTTPNMSSTKLIFSDSDFKEPNLGGCLDWQCGITNDPNKADAFINFFPPNKSFNGYVLFSTQESPANFGIPPGLNYNMSIGFRHDSPVSSPYGYTVLLDQKSWRQPDQICNKTLVEGKKLGAVWFVSHCSTNSKREALVNKLKNYIDTDVFGGCTEDTKRQCPRNSDCENKLNTHYHFYLALENSICTDYITEKLWHHSFLYTIVPIVLKRKLVEPYAPPNSFIAFDDYKSVEEMGKHLKQLASNKNEYMKYFEWRRKYEVIFLNGENHDHLERPWGLCQLCRLLHQNPLPQYRIDNLDKYWKDTCEPDGELARRLLG